MSRQTRTIAITQEIIVDSEIADEIQWLNSRGVRTEASCSGHGEYPPHALIKPSSVARATELGYIPLVGPGELFQIELCGDSFVGKKPLIDIDYTPIMRAVEQLYNDFYSMHHRDYTASLAALLDAWDTMLG